MSSLSDAIPCLQSTCRTRGLIGESGCDAATIFTFFKSVRSLLTVPVPNLRLELDREDDALLFVRVPHEWNLMMMIMTPSERERERVRTRMMTNYGSPARAGRELSGLRLWAIMATCHRAPSIYRPARFKSAIKKEGTHRRSRVSLSQRSHALILSSTHHTILNLFLRGMNHSCCLAALFLELLKTSRLPFQSHTGASVCTLSHVSQQVDSTSVPSLELWLHVPLWYFLCHFLNCPPTGIHGKDILFMSCFSLSIPSGFPCVTRHTDAQFL